MPRPTPADGELLIAVHAAAITFDELTWPETWSSDAVDRTPIVPSHEFSGVVADVGEGVSDVSVGDEVYGLVPFDRDGAAAEYVACRPIFVDHAQAQRPLAVGGLRTEQHRPSACRTISRADVGKGTPTASSANPIPPPDISRWSQARASTRPPAIAAVQDPAQIPARRRTSRCR